MRVLINVNEQISAMMMEKYFQASSLEAEVTAAPKDMMLEILKACKIDVVAFYTEEIDNAALISFFSAAGDIRKILFVKKQNLGAVNPELESMLDECFAMPLDSGEMMIRLRRMMRSAGTTNHKPKPPQPTESTVQPEFPASYRPEESEPQTEQYPAQSFAAPAEEALQIKPIKTDYLYTPESFRQNTAAQTAEQKTQESLLYQSTSNDADASFNSRQQNSGGFQVIPSIPQNNYWDRAEKPAHDQEKPVKGKNLFVKILGAASKVLFSVLILIIAVLAIFMVKSKISGGTPSVAGYQLYGVLSGSMNGSSKTSFDTGSLVLVKEKDIAAIAAGDIITFRGASMDSPLTTHRVVKVNIDGDSITFTTKGDANDVADPNPVLASKVVGTVRGHLPFLGYLTGFAETKTGLIFLVFIPGGLIIVYEMYNIFKTLKTERKKGKDR